MFQPSKRLILGMILFAIALRLIPHLIWASGRDIDPKGVPDKITATTDESSSAAGKTTPKSPVYPWNFSPLMAMCLFGAAFFTDRRRAFIIPLAVLILSDALIGLIRWDIHYAVHVAQPFTYGCLLLAVCLGFVLRKRVTAPGIVGTGLLAETVFFLVSNLGVWLLFNTYPHNFAGLLDCYKMGIPFFRNSLMGTAVYSTLLFGGYAWVVNRQTAGLKQPLAQHVEL